MSNAEQHDDLATIGLSTPDNAERLIEYKGRQYLVLAPTMEVQERIDREAVDLIRDRTGRLTERRPNRHKAGALLFIYSVLNPKTRQPVYGKEHLSAVMGTPQVAGSLPELVGIAIQEMTSKPMDEQVEEEAGNSDASPSASHA
jgi:hypothetical protein